MLCIRSMYAMLSALCMYRSNYTAPQDWAALNALAMRADTALMLPDHQDHSHKAIEAASRFANARAKEAAANSIVERTNGQKTESSRAEHPEGSSQQAGAPEPMRPAAAFEEGEGLCARSQILIRFFKHN